MRSHAALGLTLFLLWAVLAEANHSLSGLQVSLFAGGLFAAGPAFELGPVAGGTVAFLAGLLCDAGAPREVFGAQAILFAAACLVLGRMSERLHRSDAGPRVALALAANAAIFLALSLLRSRLYPLPVAAWFRLGTDLVASEAFVLLAAPWFFALQGKALAWAGADSDRRH
jgi:rod shape-determining protein MreD